MSVNTEIIAALKPIGYPVAADVYTEESDVYILITINTIPEDFADDEPHCERNLCMAHLYCPHELDTTDIQKQIKLALQSAGFTYPTKLNASGKDIQHIVFEFENIEAI